jgi:hypothetical protein
MARDYSFEIKMLKKRATIQRFACLREFHMGPVGTLTMQIALGIRVQSPKH